MTRKIVRWGLIAWGLSFSACGKWGGEGATGAALAGEEAVEVALPTEQDFEASAEANITPANLDAELAKLDAELRRGEASGPPR